MEKHIQKKINAYMSGFKEEIINKSMELGINKDDTATKLLQFICDKENLKLTKDDFVKRKRTKNVINTIERCIAKRANGECCSRRKKEGFDFCGTHIKGITYGICSENNQQEKMEKVEVSFVDINGIIYYIDNVENVYQTEYIMNNKINPKVIAKYTKNNNGDYILNFI